MWIVDINPQGGGPGPALLQGWTKGVSPQEEGPALVCYRDIKGTYFLGRESGPGLLQGWPHPQGEGPALVCYRGIQRGRTSQGGEPGTSLLQGRRFPQGEGLVLVC